MRHRTQDGCHQRAPVSAAYTERQVDRRNDASTEQRQDVLVENAECAGEGFGLFCA